MKSRYYRIFRRMWQEIVNYIKLAEDWDKWYPFVITVINLRMP